MSHSELEAKSEADHSGAFRTSRRKLLATGGAVGAGLTAGCVSTGGSGGSGDGRSLTIGYQPFYAEAWSALVIKHANLAEKYLPDGYSVDEWQVALQGSVVGNRTIAGKNQVGYTGDMPTITALVNDKTPISCTGIAGYSQGQQCNLGVVPKDSGIESVSDLDGATVGLTTGACTHRFVLRMAEEEGIDIQIKDQGINTIQTGIREGGLEVGFGWEPVMYKTVNQLDAGRYLVTGAPYGIYDAAGIIMPDELLENDPAAARQWMKAELEAKKIMAEEPERALDLISQEGELESYDRSVLEGVLYENIADDSDVERMLFTTDYTAAPPASKLMKQKAPSFLKSQGIIEKVPKGDRFKPKPMQNAIEELQSEVDWAVHRAKNGEN
jgi:NitT/TauT family transport system substrate-binding protein